MKVKSIILDTLPSHLTNNSYECANWVANNKTYLTWQIEKLLQCDRTPIIVIGDNGDELLRSNPILDKCDLVFETPNKQLFFGLTAGLQGSGTCSYYLPLNVSTEFQKIFQSLEKALHTLDHSRDIHLITPQSNKQEGYPWLITSSGRDYILKNANNLDLDLFPAPHRLSATLEPPVEFNFINNINDLQTFS